jgi:protein SCO1/2
MAWLSRIDGQAELAAMGHGTAIALGLAFVSAAIAVAVWANWRPVPFLALAIVLVLGYWVIGQSFGGIVFAGNATDPNAGPLFVLLALAMYSLTPLGRRARSGVAPRPAAMAAPLAAGVAIVVAATAMGVSASQAAPTSPQQPVTYGSPFDGLAISPPAPAPPVSLDNYQGDPITLAAYSERGDTVLLTFLSADCQADCPAIASGLHQSLTAMPAADARRLQVIVISTNPRRDNPRIVGGFLRRYGLVRRAQYLTGSPKQLRPLWKEWGISASSDAVDLSGPNALVYGIAPSGAVVTRYSAFFTPQQIVHDVKRLAML